MGLEIERKFLVRGEGWRSDEFSNLRQGYLNRSKERNVRVRVDGESAYLTIKGVTRGAARLEFEYPIPVADALHMLDSICELPLIEKRRYIVHFADKRWEVDEFRGANHGLVLAEIELTREDEPFELPPWVAVEVSHDPRYFNSNLCQSPYTTW